MAWHNSSLPYEFSEDSLNQDLELYPSSEPVVQGSSSSLPVTIAASAEKGLSGDRYEAHSMPSTKNEEAWLAWCYASTSQDMHSLPVTKARNKPSISDSGYGSMDYAGRHGLENKQNALSSEPIRHSQVSDYCQTCYEESEKRRYFSNNADRRKHMLTHTRPFKCDVSGCDNQNGFASPHDLARHKKTCHSVLTVKTSKFYYRCAAPSCQKKEKIWPRKDNFKAHLEGTHRYDEAQVAELLIKSECTPDSVQLSGAISRQRSKRRKITAKYRSRKIPSSDNEHSDVAASPSEETQESFEPTNHLFQHIAPNPMLSAPTSYPSGSLLGSFQGHANPPSILISHDAEDDEEDHVEMMDTSTDFMDDTHSPYLMIGIPSSPDEIEQPSPAYSSSTYADSLFGSDTDDVNTDTDFDTDLGECDTLFQPLLGPIVQCLLTAYISSRQHAPGNIGQESSNSSYPSSLDGPVSNGFGSSGFSLPPAGGKRRRNTKGEDDANEDDKTPKRKSRAPRSDEDLPPLACPFVKFDPLKHQKCYTYVLKGISRVKQHLERMHTIPVHCPRCYTVFRNNTEARDKHVRESTCQTVPEQHLEGIDKATMRKLKRRGTSKSVQDSWYSMFTLLFPGAKKPESPFMDTTLSVELLAFRDFCSHEGHDIVTGIASANIHSWNIQQHDQIEDFTRQIFQEAMAQLFLRWQSRRSASSEPTVVNQPMLPPTPPSTFTQDMNDMGINDTFTMTDDESLLPPQQYPDLDIAWTNSQVHQTTAAEQHWMYFGDTIPMDRGQQYWNDHRILDGMGGWSG